MPSTSFSGREILSSSLVRSSETAAAPRYHRVMAVYMYTDRQTIRSIWVIMQILWSMQDTLYIFFVIL